MKTFLTLLFYILLQFIFPPSVWAQGRTYVASADCRQVISVDFGGHSLFVEGIYGGHFGFNIENIVAEKLSFNFNAKDFMNKFSGKTTEKNIFEHRIVLQPSLSFYPRFALHGFYINAGCGAFFNFDNRKSKLSTMDVTWIQFFPDVKLGYQSIEAYNFAWNIYVGSGIFLSKKIYEAIPIFELGVKLGVKL